jgi:serine/threonine-protein kinase
MEVTASVPPRYADLRHIGKGAMADVYAARDTLLGRTVAVKVLAHRYARDEDVRRRFRREALTAARLSGDPHVVTVYDVGESDGQPHIVMEHLPGGTVAESARGRRVSWAESLRWLESAAAALDRAHALGVVHRDVTPNNLLLDERGDVKVADFGIAKVLDTLSSSGTGTGSVLGTAGYLAPEVVSGDAATAASDRYALGVVAYELLTGRRPFAGRATAAEMAARLYEDPPRASSAEPFLPPEVDPVLARALQRDADLRHASARELVAELRAALAPSGPPRSAEQRPPQSPGRSRGRGRRLWVFAGGAAAVVAIVAAVMLAGGAGAGPERPTTPERSVTRAGSPTTPIRTPTEVRNPTSAAVTRPPAATNPAPAPLPTVPEGKRLNDQAYELMRQGRWSEALPLLQRAVPALRGIGPSDPYEAYADYNLGRTLLELGRCREALLPLRRSDALQDRVELTRALTDAARCAGAGR